jgi:hypothetical protein
MIKKLPPVPTTVSYTVKLTDPDDVTHEKRYFSLLPSTENDFIGQCDIKNCETNNITIVASLTGFSNGFISRYNQTLLEKNQSCIYSDQRGIVIPHSPTGYENSILVPK